MAVLIGMSADVKGQTREINADGLSIGRSTENDLPIDNSSVSGRHCTLSLEGEHYVLRDLGSTNGTRVNGQDITETVLSPKDTLQIGSVDFLFNLEDIPLSEAEAIYNKIEIVEAAGPAVKPQSFASISPFGARRREHQGAWSTVIVILGVIAVGMVGFLLYRLFTL